MAQLAIPLRGHLEQSGVVQSGGGGRKVGSGQGIMRWGVGQKPGIVALPWALEGDNPLPSQASVFSSAQWE